MRNIDVAIPSICPSVHVCPSLADIVSKRLNLSRRLHYITWRIFNVLSHRNVVTPSF